MTELLYCEYCNKTTEHVPDANKERYVCLQCGNKEVKSMEIEDLKERIREEVSLEMYRINDMIDSITQTIIEGVELKDPSVTVEEGEAIDITILILEEIRRQLERWTIN